MTAHNFTIALNEPCSFCGRGGRVVENKAGLCLACITKALAEESSTRPAGARSSVDSPPRLDQSFKPAHGLARTLFDLILRAERARDNKFHSVPLANGLVVEVGLGTQMNLRLYRATCTPGASEFQTVIKNLSPAYQPPDLIVPREYQYVERDGSRRWYLEAHWAFAKEINSNGDKP